jgi:sugar-specific transcriptional regulator TrmB
MNLENLTELGLSIGQINVYKSVLEIGNTSLGSIQERTGIERRNIYDILNKLIEKGLISYTIESGKKTYSCIHPSKILEEIKEKENKLTQLQNTIPEMAQLYEMRRPEIKAETIRGDQGVIALLNEMLEYEESFWLGGNSFETYNSVSKGLSLNFKKWMKQRAEKKHIMYDLVSHGTHLEGLEPKNLKEHKKQYYKYNQLPKDMYSPMVIIIFGNKVAQVVWRDQPFAFIIDSKEVVESYKKYFDYFWEK